jgi:hypothetical protein
MLKKRKINKFYPVLVLVILVLFLFMAFTIRGIYDAINMTIDIGEETVTTAPHVEVEKLEKAYRGVFEKTLTPLDLVD